MISFDKGGKRKINAAVWLVRLRWMKQGSCKCEEKGMVGMSLAKRKGDCRE